MLLQMEGHEITSQTSGDGYRLFMQRLICHMKRRLMKDLQVSEAGRKVTACVIQLLTS